MTRAKLYQRISTFTILLAMLWIAVGHIPDGFAEKPNLTGNHYSIFSFSVHGATCVACLVEIDRLLRNMKGVKAVNINQTRRPLAVAVVFDQSQVQPVAITKILQSHKYQVADEKSIPYNRNTMAEFFLAPQDKIRAEDDKPNLILP